MPSLPGNELDSIQIRRDAYSYGNLPFNILASQQNIPPSWHILAGTFWLAHWINARQCREILPRLIDRIKSEPKTVVEQQSPFGLRDSAADPAEFWRAAASRVFAKVDKQVWVPTAAQFRQLSFRPFARSRGRHGVL